MFTSSNLDVATFQGPIVTAIAPGKAVIAAAVGGLVAFANVVVGPATVVSISIYPSQPYVYTGYKGFGNNLNATAIMSDGSQKDVTREVTWTSASPMTAYVGNNGDMVGLSPGTVQITATLGTVTATVTATVTGPAAKHLTVQSQPPAASPGDIVTAQVVANFDDYESQPLSYVTWGSSNPSVLQLSPFGSGFAASQGKTVLTAKIGGIVVGTTEVTVTTAHVDHIEISPATLLIDAPTRGHLTAYAVYTDGSKFDFSSIVLWNLDDYSVVQTGPVPGDLYVASLGTVRVTADYLGSTATANVTVGPGYRGPRRP